MAAFLRKNGKASAVGADSAITLSKGAHIIKRVTNVVTRSEANIMGTFRIISADVSSIFVNILSRMILVLNFAFLIYVRTTKVVKRQKYVSGVSFALHWLLAS